MIIEYKEKGSDEINSVQFEPDFKEFIQLDINGMRILDFTGFPIEEIRIKFMPNETPSNFDE